MHTEKREDPLVELGYEVRDLNTKAIRNAAIGFFTFALGSGIVGFVIFRLMNPAGFTAEKAQHRLLPLEPNPIVQSNLAAKTDIMDLRQHERSVLEAPIGWTDNTHTRLHIPIQKAMEIIANRHQLPGSNAPAVPVAPAAPASKPTSQPLGVPPAGGSTANPPIAGGRALTPTGPSTPKSATNKPATTQPATTPKRG